MRWRWLPEKRGKLADQALGLVPLAAGMLMAAVILPRAVPPEDLPLPIIDGRALSRVEARDDALAADARTNRLPSVVRALGSAVRAFDTDEAKGAVETFLAVDRDTIVGAMRDALRESGPEPIEALRALQEDEFLAEIRRFERTGLVTPELVAIAGTFVPRTTKVGWCVGHQVDMSDDVRRAIFKVTWNRLVALDQDPRFALTLDESRVLYAFYLTHAHPPESERGRIDALRALPGRSGARAAEAAERKATASWLLAKIGELSHVDAEYPGVIARAGALYMRGDYAGSADLYAEWLNDHPSGPWTLRVENHLRAALVAEEL